MYKVLIIDDDKLARKGLRMVVPWEQCGFTVVGDVANGALALDFMEQEEVDLAVVDLVMPVLSGLDFIRECQKRYPATRYIVLSSHESFDYAQDALRLGVYDYISKLRLDQEDCGEIFRRAAAKLDEERAAVADSRPAEERRRLTDGFCREMDSFRFLYNRSEMEDLRKRISGAGLNETARYQLFRHMAWLLDWHFGVQTEEGLYVQEDDSFRWMEKARDVLCGEIRAKSGDADTEGLLLLAADFIEEHLTDYDLQTETIAENVHMSRSYFSSSFKKYAGCSVNAYIRMERIRLACRLAEENPGMTLADAAWQSGYRDEKYFAKVFREVCGQSFAEYKKEHRRPE